MINFENTGDNPPAEQFNIVLTKDGEEIDFHLPLVEKDMNLYILPKDSRCVAQEFCVDDVQRIMGPVLGKSAKNLTLYSKPKKVIEISLHNTSILRYVVNDVIDPRLSNVIAEVVATYSDPRIFTDAEVAILHIVENYEDEEFPRQLASDIKDKLLRQSKQK